MKLVTLECSKWYKLPRKKIRIRKWRKKKIFGGNDNE